MTLTTPTDSSQGHSQGQRLEPSNNGHSPHSDSDTPNSQGQVRVTPECTSDAGFQDPDPDFSQKVTNFGEGNEQYHQTKTNELNKTLVEANPEVQPTVENNDGVSSDQNPPHNKEKFQGRQGRPHRQPTQDGGSDVTLKVTPTDQRLKSGDCRLEIAKNKQEKINPQQSTPNTQQSKVPFKQEEVNLQSTIGNRQSVDPQHKIIDWNYLIHLIDEEIERLGWSTEFAQHYIIKTYGKRSRQLLSDEQLIEFHHYLKNLDTPFQCGEHLTILKPEYQGMKGELINIVYHKALILSGVMFALKII